jgi:hypothetical protein
MALTVSKYGHTDSLKKLMRVQDECEVKCHSCNELVTISQKNALEMMINGLQVECGECNIPPTTTTISDE